MVNIQENYFLRSIDENVNIKNSINSKYLPDFVDDILLLNKKILELNEVVKVKKDFA